MIGIHYQGRDAAEYMGKKDSLGGSTFYLYRVLEGPYEGSTVWSESAPSSIYVVPVAKINTFEHTAIPRTPIPGDQW